jgi:hypothetical protein
MSNQLLNRENNFHAPFLYCFEDAADLIFQQIPPSLQERIQLEDILFVLECKDEYLDMTYPITKPVLNEFPQEINISDMIRFLMNQIRLEQVDLSEHDLTEILDAELYYFETNGALRDAGEWLN